MLTFLSIEKPEKKRFLPLGNKISVELRSVDGVDIKHIRYIHRHGKIRYDRIRKFSGEEAGRLLTKEDLVFPQDSGLRRFYCDELRSRLCLNMAIAVLESLKKSSDNIKVAVYDPEARVADGIGAILRYTDKLTAVTRMTGIYSAESERIMEESGAVLSVSRCMKSIGDAKLIVCPQKLKTQLPLGKDAVILTVSRPAVSQKCTVYYKYYFSLSEELISLLPEGFDAEYLASALYTLTGRYDLGSIIPQATKGDGTVHTLVSLSKYLMNIACNT